MANKWQSSFNDELKKMATTEKTAWEWPTIQGMKDTATKGIKSLTGAKEGEGWFPGNQSKGMNSDNPFVTSKAPSGDSIGTGNLPGNDIGESVETKVETKTEAKPKIEAPTSQDVSADSLATGYSTDSGTFGGGGEKLNTTQIDSLNSPKADAIKEKINVTEAPKVDTPAVDTPAVVPPAVDTPAVVPPAEVAGPKKTDDWGVASSQFSASSDKYTDLNSAAKYRSGLDKGSDEYMSVQSDINKSFGKSNKSNDYYKTMESAPAAAPKVDPSQHQLASGDQDGQSVVGNAGHDQPEVKSEKKFRFKDIGSGKNLKRMFPGKKKEEPTLAGDSKTEKTSAFIQDIINNQKLATVSSGKASKGKMVSRGNMDKDTYNSIKNDVKSAGGNPFANGGDPFAKLGK